MGNAPFNAGVTIKVRSEEPSRGAVLAKGIMSKAVVGLLVRAAGSKQDRALLEVFYAAGLRVSEVVALTWSDVHLIKKQNMRRRLSARLLILDPTGRVLHSVSSSRVARSRGRTLGLRQTGLLRS